MAQSACAAAQKRKRTEAASEQVSVTAEMLHQLLAHSTDMFMLGNGNVCEFESASMQRVLGYSMLGPLQYHAVHPDDREAHGVAIAALFEKTLATGQPAWLSRELRLRAHAGYIWIRDTFCYSGARWYCVLVDISEAKRVERVLRDFLATTSHDARTPLNSIQVAAQLLRERTLTSEAAELLTAITASARVLHLLIDNVMVTQRLDQGDYDVSPSPVDIRAVVDEACATARAGLAQQAGTPVLWNDAPLPALILSRAEGLSHMLLNVACFCVQSAEGTPVHVHASCARAPAPDAAGRTHVLLLRVSSGRALSADELANVFDPYTDGTGRDWLDKGRGSGRLGLHVSRRLACALGGELAVTSDETHGTAFAASIPVLLADDAAAPPVTLASPAAEAAPAAVQPPAAPPSSSDEDLGVLPFLPPDMPPSESFVSMQQRGMVSVAADLLLANTSDAYVACEGMHVRYMSPGALAMLQYASLEEAPPMLMDYVHADDVPAVTSRLLAAATQSAQQGGATVTFNITLRGRRKDGSYIWMESRACATPTHLYTATSDISDRMRREASLRGFLASIMADMRQPLTSLQAASELLAAQRCVRGDEESAFLVSALSAGCAMLMGIVSNVLSFRSLEAGECVVDAAPCSLRAVVANVLGVCRMSLAHRTDVSIVWADDTVLPARVLCDKRLLSHVLLNLLTNAVKFADGTAVTVTMRCEPLAGGDTTQQELTLCVADGGRGMTAEEQLTCFLPHVHSPTSAGGGTGLGLCICKRFVEALGGSLRVDSAPGQGARFTVAAPVALVDSSDGTPSPSAPCSVGAAPGGGSSATDAPLLPPPMAALVSPAGAAPARPPPMLSSDGRRMRCLLVDDHSMNRRLCGRLLEVQCGLEVATAEDGAVALAALIASRTPGGTPFDFVLMDLQMPRMDGLQATRHFRTWEQQRQPAPPLLPMFALSANVFEEKEAECSDAGLDGFLSKPLRLDALRAALVLANVIPGGAVDGVL